jgi:hypothetical protein
VLFDAVPKVPGIRSYHLQARGLVTKYEEKLFRDKNFRLKHDFVVVKVNLKVCVAWENGTTNRILKRSFPLKLLL